jgi:hypothetical protein
MSQFNPTQLKDLEYICELAGNFLQDSGGTWPERIRGYRKLLLSMIEEPKRDLAQEIEELRKGAVDLRAKLELLHQEHQELIKVALERRADERRTL